MTQVERRVADRGREGRQPRVRDVPARAETSRHRADIDGLRAVAVLAVILTHAGVSGFAGGFVGVDVFFVISGYLIYRDLARRLHDGRLSLPGFYGRRLRRTLPALYAVGVATLAGATCVMMPGDLDELARSLMATILLVPNIFFLTQTGYFDAAAGTKPLLHAWSLGVEEQFYLLAPILPLVLQKVLPDSRRLALCALTGVTLAGCIALRQVAPAAAFYLMPARAFEFLIGAAVAEEVLPPVLSPWLAEVVALAALATLGLSIALFTEDSPHPGPVTLAPCLATAAIIHVGSMHRTLVSALLGLRVAAFIGLISYSLYLWHWPILVLSRAASLPETAATMAAQAGLLMGLSVLSWYVIETPFRRLGSVWRLRAPWLIPSGAAALVGVCALVVALHGLPQRFPSDVASVASYYAYRDQKPFREGQCFVTSKTGAANFDRGTCLKIVAGAPNVLLLGDSEAAHLWTGLRHTWPHLNVLQATASGCKPVIGTEGAARCTRLMRDMLQDFIPKHHLDALVVAGAWTPADLAPLKRTLESVRPFVGKTIVFGPMPHYDEPAATLVAKSILRGQLDEVPRHISEDVPTLDGDMRAELSPVATYVALTDALCPQGHCAILAAAGVPMQFDFVHLTPQGADVVLARVNEQHPALFPTQ